MKQGAIALSLNFMVVIIISLVVFAFGISFLYSIVSNAEDLKDRTLGDIDSQINNLMCDSQERVCIGTPRITIKPKNIEVIGVRVLNIENNDMKFKLELSEGIYTNKENEVFDPGAYTNNIYVLPMERIENIKANDAEEFAFGFQPERGTMKGTYVYNLRIYKMPSMEQYGSLQKIYITIP